VKPAIQRALAQQDIRSTFDYYLSVASAEAAAGFVREMDACMQRIEHYPAAGALRYAELLNVEGLRCAVVERFPYLVFYFERADYLDIVRVLHQHRDIPGILAEQT